MITQEIIEQARRLEILTRRKVNANFAGQYHSAFKGRGMEFAEIRQYLPGDDIRAIDWNVTARTGEPFIKTFVEERELTLLLAIDGSSSSLFGSGAKSKRQLAAELAAVLSLTAIRQQDKVGLMVFTDSVEHYVPPTKGRRHCLKLITDILQFDPIGQRTDVNVALETSAQILKKKTIIFLISDFIAPDFERSVKLINQRHDLIAVNLIDPRELELPNAGLLDLHDWESGQTILVDTGSKAVREAYAKAQKARLIKQKRLFQRLGVDQINLRTDRSFVPELINFFHRRGQVRGTR